MSLFGTVQQQRRNADYHESDNWPQTLTRPSVGESSKAAAGTNGTGLDIYIQRPQSTATMRWLIRLDYRPVESTTDGYKRVLGLEPDYQYAVEVRAYDTATEARSPDSVIVFLTTADASGNGGSGGNDAPNVTDFRFSRYSSTTGAVLWTPAGNAAAGVAGYELFRDGALIETLNSAGNNNATVGDGDPANDGPMQSGVSYVYQIKTVMSDGRRSSGVSLTIAN